ncbi:MAG TPA: guanylate kinase [Acidimicrobiales bacterium]|nr:guanylate kinase [Acidimicrobiales bacterium]
MIIVVFGPGGVGKGALVQKLLEIDDRLWLSRSWTTRPRRPHEADDAYVFVAREEFLAAIEAGRFLETNEFAGNGELYGTPWPDAGDDLDVVLEIDLNGARQVKQRFPDALAILVEPPSIEELERRLRGRGDDEAHVRKRLDLAEYEMTAGREVADHVIVNDDLARAAAEVARILESRR